MRHLPGLVLVGAAAAGAPAEVALTVTPAMVKGPSDAPVTIVEFSDYQGPFCRRLQRSLEQVLKDAGGRVRLIFKDRPLAIHPRARAAHEAARCAGAQGRYWEYHDRLFAGQPAFGDRDLRAYAAALGLDRAAFTGCVDERRFALEVEADVDQAVALGVFATPTLFVNGRRVEGLVPVEELRSIIENALDAASKERR